MPFNRYENCFSFHLNQSLSRPDLRLLYQFWGYLIWIPKFKKGRKRKANIFLTNKKHPSMTLLSKLDIESEYIKAVNKTKSKVLQHHKYNILLSVVLTDILASFLQLKMLQDSHETGYNNIL